MDEYFKSVFAPLREALKQPNVVEIQLSNNGVVFQQKLRGEQSDSGLRLSEDDALKFLRLCAHYADETIGAAKEIFNGMIIDGDERFRVNGSIPPTSPKTLFSVRRYMTQYVTLSQLVANKMISEKQYEQLHEIVRGRQSVLVAGATGAGKTTLLNALLDVARTDTQRFVVIEEEANEIQINHLNVAEFQNTERTSTAELVKNALRTSPDRLIVGEIRDSELAYAFLRSVVSGHGGSMSTIHSTDSQGAWDVFCGLLRQRNVATDEVRGCLPAILHIRKINNAPGRVLSEIAEVQFKDGKFNIQKKELNS